MGKLEPNNNAANTGSGVPQQDTTKAAQALSQASPELTDDKSPTKRISPRVIAERNWQAFFEIAKKMNESEHMALVAILHAEPQPDGSITLSRLGRNAINIYLNEDATLDVVKSPLELGQYRIKRAKRFFDKKSVGEAKKECMQDLLLEIAYDIPYIEKTFADMQKNAAQSANTQPKPTDMPVQGQA